MIRREAYYGDEWKLIAEVHRSTDGTKDVISSDETWSVTRRSNLWFSISMTVKR